MAPLPSMGTARVWVHYQGPAGPHEVMFRFDEFDVVADCVASARSICLAMAGFLTTDTTFDGARYAARGSVISMPVAWSNVPGTSGDTFTGEEYPNFVTWMGRDVEGRRVRWALNGIPLNADTDYRVQVGDIPASDVVIAAIRGASPPPRTINNLIPVVYNYANTGRNAYFQRKRRRSA